MAYAPLILILISGCGITQNEAEKACQIFNSGKHKATVAAFASLARENPAYFELLNSAQTIVQYDEEVRQFKINRQQYLERKSKGEKGIEIFDTPPSNNFALQAQNKIKLFCTK